ncbi:hypothetical protein ISS42_00635 [Candidatus Shapirobacteria bacterium]|nr:hypothetical protein [Candidatus Shapirobacteria bacterium]
MKELKKIPKFNSEEEEKKFWMTHDSTDYFLTFSFSFKTLSLAVTMEFSSTFN